MAPEMIEVYSDKGKLLGVKENKQCHDAMREEFLRTGKVSIHHKHSRVLLLASSGKLILQKRSKWKGDNPGLWDKTVGGHAFRHESYDFTAVRECAEEMRIPSTVVAREHLKEALGLIDTHAMAVMFLVEVDGNDVSLRSERGGKTWKEPSSTAYYLGYYDGPIRFNLSEASGFRISSLKEIEEEMLKEPEAFANDLFKMLSRMRNALKPVDEIR